MNLRKLAKGRECLIRVPGYCSSDPEQTVGCHLRMAGITGISQKAPDLFIAWGCYPCHQVCDGQRKSEFTADERRLMLLEGMVRTAVPATRRREDQMTGSAIEAISSLVTALQGEWQ